MFTLVCLAFMALILFLHGTFQPSSMGVIILEAFGLVVPGVIVYSLHEKTLRNLCRS